jgi:hypothetical protein
MSWLTDDHYLRKSDFDTHRLRTGHVCPCCGEEVDADDDVALLLVVRVQVNAEGELEYFPETDDEGDFSYSPQFVHLVPCFNDLYSDLQHAVEPGEEPKQLDEEVVRCDICMSSILGWELLLFTQPGEFYTSPRAPSGDDSQKYRFRPRSGKDQDDSHICLSCTLNLVGTKLVELEDISEGGECNYCSHAQCWRTEGCSCPCHK